MILIMIATLFGEVPFQTFVVKGQDGVIRSLTLRGTVWEETIPAVPWNKVDSCIVKKVIRDEKYVRITLGKYYGKVERKPSISGYFNYSGDRDYDWDDFGGRTHEQVGPKVHSDIRRTRIVNAANLVPT